LDQASNSEKRIRELEERVNALQEENEKLKRDHLTLLYKRGVYEHNFSIMENQYIEK
jgi:hypothetical protein